MNIIEVENQFYILATSSFADQRTMVLKQGDSFAIFGWHGDIHQIGQGKQGIFHDGTRFVSRMDLEVNGVRPLLLSSTPRDDNQMLIVDLTNPDLPKPGGELLLFGSIHIERTKLLWESTYHEKMRLKNFNLKPERLRVEMRYEADFADIFEIRGQVRERKGERLPTQQSDGAVTFAYRGLDDVVRKTRIHFEPSPDEIRGGTVVWNIDVGPQEEREILIDIAMGETQNDLVRLPFDGARTAMNMYMERINRYCADITTSNEQFNDWIKRSKSDLITMTSQTPHGLYPYAGVPWYSTPFGRDGIITALQCLWVEPELARGVLVYLAHTQATDFNDFQDAEPGKIFHEARGGEMAALGEIPFKMYYGTIDATPLFICLAGAYLERTNDLKTISRIWPNIEKALFWIDHYGDIDGDGFLEYKTKSAKGLINQGWKDSHDSVFHEDGTMAKDPIALCEVQGYAYDAKVKASKIARVLGLEDKAIQLIHEARELKYKFNEAFWSDSRQTYVIALDGDKKPCDVESSNAGHCLFSGIATPERASIIAKGMMSDRMFSGWGIRTIARGEPRYNPMSYHNGSIWPHDNSMIASGLSRYGLMDDTLQVLNAMFDTSTYVEAHRLPELFCGFPREAGKAPVSYPVACSPQAWAVGTLYLMLQAMLGMKIDAASNSITLCHPVLPPSISDITVTNLQVNDKLVIFQVRRTNNGIEAFSLTPGNGLKIHVTNNIVTEEEVVA